MHVVDVTMFYAAHGGGVQRYLQAKRRWLEARPGWRHSLVVPEHTGGLTQGAVEVPGLPLPFSNGYRLPLRKLPAVQALLDLQPDIIEAGDPYRLAWAALDAGQALSVPVVGFCHSDLAMQLARWCGQHGEQLVASYLQRLYSRFDEVLAPSAAMAEKLRSLGIAQVRRQPLGVDSRVFRPDCRRGQIWRRRLFVGATDRLLVFVGRFAPEKNLPVLYAALDRLGSGHVLVLVGCGQKPPERPDLRHVPYIADPERLAGLIAECDVFVHAGDQETFGLAALEAMSCGIPVVAVRAGGLAELVDDEVGAAVPANSPEALADAIRRLFRRDLAPLRAAARRRAESYDWACVIPRIASRYAALRSKGRDS